MTFRTGRRVAVLAAVLAVVSACALTGCSQVSSFLGINTSTEISKTLTPVLNGGTTIKDGVLTVGVNKANSPYGGTNKNNDTVGLDVDVAAALCDDLGMKLQIVDVAANGKAALADGQVDVALGATKSGSAGTIAYTTPYINDGSSLFCKSENADKPTQDIDTAKKGQKILVQANTATAYEVQESLGVDSVTVFETMKEAFDALENGEGVYLAADAVIGDYFARTYSDIVRVNFLSSESVTPIYATTLASNVELSQALNTSLSTISGNGVLRVIVDKWLGPQGEDLLPGKVDIASIPDAFATKKK